MWGVMNLYSVSGKLLFSSRQLTVRRALIEAVQAGAGLHGVDLRGARLCGALLDGMIAPGACLWGADLSGCDMADADITGADARLARFTGACLAGSLCAGGLFDGACFQNALITDADFNGCRFTCPSALSLPWHLCRDRRGAVYWDRGEHALPLDDGIVHVQTGDQHIVLLGRHILVNGSISTRSSDDFLCMPPR